MHYFLVEGRKVCIIWDSPHLLKCSRNQWVKKGRLTVILEFLFSPLSTVQYTYDLLT